MRDSARRNERLNFQFPKLAELKAIIAQIDFALPDRVTLLSRQ